MLNAMARHVTGVITSVETAEPIVALTFDDGPDPAITPQVLDVLSKYGARATFFMVGKAACCFPEIVMRVASEGHVIGNHSWSHLAFPSISLTERWSQITRCQQIIKPYGQTILRPPYGMSNTRSSLHLLLQGYKSIGWSVSPEDCYENNSEAMVDSMVQDIKPGCIILLHDSVFDKGMPVVGPAQTRRVVIDRTFMLVALDELLNRLNNQFEFVTIPELLRRGKPCREESHGK